MLKRLALCLMLLTAAASMHAAALKVTSNTEFIFEKYGNAYFKLKKYLRTADSLTSMFIKSSNSKLIPRLIIIDGLKMKGDISIIPVGSSISIYINSDFAAWQDSEQVNKYLISYLLLTKCGIKPEDDKSPIPDWILTGIWAELKYKTSERTFSPTNYYPGLMALTHAGDVPDVYHIINMPLDTSDGMAYELYEEACRFLLLESFQLSRGKENAIVDIVILAASGKYSKDEMFNSTIGRLAAQRFTSGPNASLLETEKTKLWFDNIAKRKFINYFFPLDAEAVEAEIKQISPMTCEVKVSGSDYKKITLDFAQLPDYWIKIKDRQNLKSKLLNDLHTLQAKAPPLLVQPLSELIKAVSNLGERTSNLEKDDIKRALDLYYATNARQAEIEKLLENTEYQYRSVKEVYLNEYKVINQEKEAPWPALETYLDSVEKKYLGQ